MTWEQVTSRERGLRTLRLLASGLVQASEEGLVQPREMGPYNEALQRAANRLAVDLLLSGSQPPKDLGELFELCHRPLSEWPLTLPESALYGQLLIGGRPTATCYEWAITGARPEWELVSQLMPRLMDCCRLQGKPDWYTYVRRELIRHPVLDRKTEAQWHLDPVMGELVEECRDGYERIPEHLAVEEQFWCCGYCGWTLERDERGIWHCGDEQCGLIAGDPYRKAKPLRQEEATRRLRAPLRRFLLLPGIPELRLGDWLEEQGLAVRFWPDYDRCDLQVSLAGGEVWEVDVKDWSVPFTLAAAIEQKPPRLSDECTRFFYVIPDHRERLFPGYVRALESALRESGPLRRAMAEGRLAVLSMKKFQRRVQGRLKGGEAGA